MSNTPFINRSLTTIHNELEFLKESGVVSEQLFNELSELLPRKYTPGAPPIGPIGTLSAGPGGGQLVSEKSPVPPPPVPTPSYDNGNEVVEAMYDYQARDATDLPLSRGSRISVLEKLNGDWWRGRDMQSGREGIFPSNYVKSIGGGPGMEKKEAYMPPVSPAPSQQSYYPPPQQSAPPYYPPPSTNYYQQPPPEVVVQQPQEHHHSGASNAMKKFGSKLGNAAIFGAGATIGSDIVNSIF